MSRRTFNYKMLNAADISTNQTSENTNVDGVDEASIFIYWSGTSPVGAITIEASNSNKNEFDKGEEVWKELDFGAAISISGATGSHQINFNKLPFRMIRCIYTSTSGTGKLTAHMNAISVGA